MHYINVVLFKEYLAYLKHRLEGLDRRDDPLVEEPDEQQGSSNMTTISDLKEKLQIMLGEITSGNTSKILKNELAKVLHYLDSKKKISKQKYEHLIHLTY